MREELEQKIHEFAEQMYKAGYEDCKKAELTDVRAENIAKHHYQRGLNDAWECAKKIILRSGYSRDELIEIFGVGDICTIIDKLTALEAVTKIKEYEEKKKQTDDEIKVGDGVVSVFGKHGYVTGIDKDELYVLYPNGEVGHSSANIYVKDGRYFPQIAEVLKQMKEEQ